MAQTTIEKVLLPYLYKYADEIRKTTRLLKEYFGTEGFAYQKIESNGNYVAVTDSPAFAEYCFDNNVHQDCIYLRHPNAFNSGLIFNDKVIPAKDGNNLLTFGNHCYDVHNTVTILKKNQESVEMIYLIAKAHNKNLNTLAWKHQMLLLRYLDFFKRELASCLQAIEYEEINLAKLQPENFSCQRLLSFEFDQRTQYDFLKAIGYEDIFDKAKVLSTREKDCLAILLQGKRAKETAARLGLSSRTVEAYLEKIKTKLGCAHKADLFTLAQALHALNLL